MTKAETISALKAYYGYINKDLYYEKPDKSEGSTGVFTSSVPAGVMMTDLGFLRLIDKVYLAIESLIVNDLDAYMYVKMKYDLGMKNEDAAQEFGCTTRTCKRLHVRALGYVGKLI